MNFRRGFIAIFAVALMSFAVAGCGEDDDTSATAPAGGEASEEAGNAGSAGSADDEASESESAEGGGGGSFAKQADAICARAKAELATELTAFIGEAGAQNERQALSESTAKILLPSMESQIVELEELDVPPAREEQVAAFLSAWRQGIERAKGMARAPAGQQVEMIFEPAGKLARRDGYEECAYG